MTATRPAPSVTPDTDRAAVRRAALPVATACLAVSAALSITRGHSLAEGLTETAVELVATLLLFGLVVRRGLRKPSAGVRGVVLGGLGLLLVVVAFWSGLPLLFGATAVLLGLAGRRAAHGAGTAVASLVVGSLAVVGYVGVYILDFVLNP